MAVADWTEEELHKQANRLRRDIATSEEVLPDTADGSDDSAQNFFLESEETYPSDTSKMLAYARVIALKGIRASAALLGKYAQNQSEEDLTKVFDNITELLRDAQAEVERVADPIADDVSPFFFGVARGQRGR